MFLVVASSFSRLCTWSGGKLPIFGSSNASWKLCASLAVYLSGWMLGSVKLPMPMISAQRCPGGPELAPGAAAAGPFTARELAVRTGVASTNGFSCCWLASEGNFCAWRMAKSATACADLIGAWCRPACAPPASGNTRHRPAPHTAQRRASAAGRRPPVHPSSESARIFSSACTTRSTPAPQRPCALAVLRADEAGACNREHNRRQTPACR